ncbi:MAG: hypothetical protein MJH09_04625 [Cetobacterium sp.]|nr:hypothetical protein [Cetobacterium sp.]
MTVFKAIANPSTKKGEAKSALDYVGKKSDLIFISYFYFTNIRCIQEKNDLLAKRVNSIIGY